MIVCRTSNRRKWFRWIIHLSTKCSFHLYTNIDIISMIFLSNCRSIVRTHGTRQAANMFIRMKTIIIMHSLLWLNSHTKTYRASNWYRLWMFFQYIKYLYHRHHHHDQSCEQWIRIGSIIIYNNSYRNNNNKHWFNEYSSRSKIYH